MTRTEGTRESAPPPVWRDVVLVAGLAVLGCAAVGYLRLWTLPASPAAQLDPSPAALPLYTSYSLMRGAIAYALSLVFALIYGYWAARDPRAERVLMPLLDILQSIPVVGFMPGLVLTLAALVPGRQAGLELASILLIFTGQAWNLAFSFHESLGAVNREHREVAAIHGFSAWQRLRWIELPTAAVGLVWNSALSVSGGWFFLMLSEAFVLGDRDFRLPGLGSYMSAAVAAGDVPAMVAALAAMALLIVALDQLVWRPLTAWSQRFRSDDVTAGPAPTTWFLDLVRGSRLAAALGRYTARPSRGRSAPRPATPWPRHAATLALVLLVAGLLRAAVGLGAWLAPVSLADWIALSGATLVTGGRVFLALLLGTLWTVPAGIAIGLSPRAARALAPVIQFAASFPAPMLFPALALALDRAGLPLGGTAVALMLVCAQWYLLFNVAGGAGMIPAELSEASRAFALTPAQRFFRVHVPAVFPALVTGWVTAAGAAWNASIVTESLHLRGRTVSTFGIGAAISDAAGRADLPRLAAALTVLAVAVVALNRTLWRACFARARSRYSTDR